MDQRGHLFLRHLFRRLFEFASQRTSNLTSNARCNFPEQCTLVFGKRPALVLERLQFLPSNFVQTGAQRDDGRYHVL